MEFLVSYLMNYYIGFQSLSSLMFAGAVVLAINTLVRADHASAQEGTTDE